MTNPVLEDELIAVDAIYPGCIELSAGSTNTYALRCPDADQPMVFLTFGPDYPQIRPRVVSASGTVEKDTLEAYLDGLGGSEVICAIVEVLGDIYRCAPVEVSHTPEQQRYHVQWHVGDSIVDRKSVMLGRATKVTSMEEVHAALENVKQDKTLQRATHPCIYAYRFTSSDGKIVHDSDDDGESGAGAKLAFLLDVTSATNVLLVVSRWFGGILLGEIRFKHIVSAGRNALQVGSFIDSTQSRKG